MPSLYDASTKRGRQRGLAIPLLISTLLLCAAAGLIWLISELPAVASPVSTATASPPRFQGLVQRQAAVPLRSDAAKGDKPLLVPAAAAVSSVQTEVWQAARPPIVEVAELPSHDYDLLHPPRLLAVKHAGVPDAKACQRYRKELQKLRAKMRNGYTAKQYNALAEKDRELTSLVYQQCR